MTPKTSVRQSTISQFPKKPRHLTKEECVQYLDSFQPLAHLRPASWDNFTAADYQQRCVEITQTKSLHGLEIWLIEHGLSQGTWENLYLNIVTFVSSKGFYKLKSHVFCIIRQQINQRQIESTAIFNQLGLRMENMADLYGDICIPSGEPNHQVFDGNQLIASIWLVNNAYFLPNSNRGSGDPYTEALALFPVPTVQAIRSQLYLEKLAVAIQ
jgi:hypothetical protein